MAEHIATRGVHHFRFTVSDVDRAVAFYTQVLGFKKLMDLNPGAFLSNGQVGLGIGPHPFPERAMKGDRFDENRIGLDHMSFRVASRAVLEQAARVLDQRGVSHSEIRDLGSAFKIYILIFRDPDNIQLELTAPHAAPTAARKKPAKAGGRRRGSARAARRAGSRRRRA